MTHIVFNEAAAAVLQQAIELDESLQGEIVTIQDDYSVGPLQDIYVGEGMEARRQWWKEVREGGDFEQRESPNDANTIAGVVGNLRRNDTETVWIWAAQNKQDVCGYYWLLHYLKEFQGRVMILYLNNLPFINEKGNIFYPVSLQEIAPKEFLKARKLARDITPSEFEVDPDEWLKLMAENKGVRILEGGKKLQQQDYSFYDADLKKQVTGDWQKASKILQHYFGKAKHTTGEDYLLWRLKKMIADSLFDVQGKLANMKDFECKLHA